MDYKFIVLTYRLLVVDPLTYLSDASGRQVTPFILTRGPPDPLPPNAGASPTRAYHKAHGNRTAEQKQRAILASLRAHGILNAPKVVIPKAPVPRNVPIDGFEDTDDESTDSSEECKEEEFGENARMNPPSISRPDNVQDDVDINEEDQGFSINNKSYKEKPIVEGNGEDETWDPKMGSKNGDKPPSLVNLGRFVVR